MVVRGLYLIPEGMPSQLVVNRRKRRELAYFHTNLLVHALLSLFYLLFQLLDGGTIWRGAIGLEDLDIPKPIVNLLPS